MKRSTPLTYRQKIVLNFKPFYKKHLIGIIAGAIALITFWVEKVNVPDSEEKISNFLRIGNEIHSLQLAIITYQQAVSYTLRNRKEYRMLLDTNQKNVDINDSTYISALSTDVSNEVVQEIICDYTYKRQRHLEGDSTYEFDKDMVIQKQELVDKLKTANFDTIANYVTRKRQENSNNLPYLKKASQTYLNKLWYESKVAFRWYIFWYLFAAAILTLDKIINVKTE